MLYRPKWTCGKYHAPSKTAIMYNLRSGQSFLFEDESADIIGEILSHKREELFSTEDLHNRFKADFSCEDIIEFLEVLSANGLLQKKEQCGIEEGSDNEPKTDDYNVPSAADYSPRPNESAYAERTQLKIVTAMIELTYKCSEKCVHCYNPGAPRNDSNMDNRQSSKLNLNQYITLIDQLIEEGLVRICLSGGDPFSSPYAWEIIDYLYSKEIAIEIFTNGQALSQNDNVKRLSEYHPCSVGLSIYSTRPEIHDRITRKKGAYDRTLSTLKQLVALSIPVEVKCCLMKYNYKYYGEVRDLAFSYGCTFQLESAIFDSIDGDSIVSKELRLTSEQFREVCTDPISPRYVGKENEYGKKDLDPDQNMCSAGRSAFTFTPEGDMIPCASFHLKIGNVLEQSVKELLSSRCLSDWEKLTLKDYIECGKHEYCNWCKPCPGQNLASTGNYLAASENACFVARNRYELAKSLR